MTFSEIITLTATALAVISGISAYVTLPKRLEDISKDLKDIRDLVSAQQIRHENHEGMFRLVDLRLDNLDKLHARSCTRQNNDKHSGSE